MATEWSKGYLVYSKKAGRNVMLLSSLLLRFSIFAAVLLTIFSLQIQYTLSFLLCEITWFLSFSALGIWSNLFLSQSFCNSFSNTPQARRELRRLKEEARNKLAIAVIWAYWLGFKVLHATVMCPFLTQPASVINQEFNHFLCLVNLWACDHS